MGAPEGLLEVEDLVVTYGSVLALDGVSLSVADGGATCLLGPNGAGKTTLLRALSGLLAFHGGRITAGRVRFGGQTITGTPADRLVAHGLVQVLEGRRVFANLSVDDNLRSGALRSGALRARALRSGALRSGALRSGALRPRAEARAEARANRPRRVESRQAAPTFPAASPRVTMTRDQVLSLFPPLASRLSVPAGLLSGGEQQMLAIARALMCSPRLLLLDEPSLGLAPLTIRAIGEALAEINAAGVAILLVEQSAALARAVTRDGYLLEHGRIGGPRSSTTDLTASDRVRAAYLGGASG